MVHINNFQCIINGIMKAHNGTRKGIKLFEDSL